MKCQALHLDLSRKQRDLATLAKKAGGRRHKYGPPAHLVSQIRKTKELRDEAQRLLTRHHEENGCEYAPIKEQP